jgi:hypothetical protein
MFESVSQNLCLSVNGKQAKQAGKQTAGLFSALCLSLTLALFPTVSQAFSVAVLTNPNQDQDVSTSKSGNVTQAQVAALANYDVIVFIDASRSMDKKDCAGKSRWEWCQEQTTALGNTLKAPLGSHLKVVAFNDSFKEYPDVDWAAIPTFFQRHRPSGNTDATRAIKKQLDSFFAARSSGTARPLLVAMITDGCPDKPQSLRDTLIEATRKLDNPSDLAITFLQVGSDPVAKKYLEELDECLVSRKAKYDIVSSKPFAELNQMGLVQALLQSVSEEHVATAK